MNKMLFVAILGLWACGKELEQGTPEATAKGFLEALNAANFEEAKGYVVKSSYRHVYEIEASYNMSSKEEREMLYTKTDQLKCAEDEGQMVCTACCDGRGDKAVLSLMQDNNKWFINLDL